MEISRYAIKKQQINGKRAYHTSLDNLPMFRDKQSDIGFCNDVIEHIPEEFIVPSLEEMARICSDYLLMSICPAPSHHLSLAKENLHLTIKPKNWWEELLNNYGKVMKKRFLFSRSVRYIIYLKSQAHIYK